MDDPRTKRRVNPKLELSTALQRKIYDLIVKYPGVTKSELAEAGVCSYSTLKRAVGKLLSMGLVEEQEIRIVAGKTVTPAKALYPYGKLSGKVGKRASDQK